MRSRKKGFTLVELLIAVGIFSIVILAVTGIFLSLNSVQRQIRDKENVLDQLRFAVDLFGQEILSGSAFPNPDDTCSPSVSTRYKEGCPNIVFATKIRPDIELRRIEYCLDDTVSCPPGVGSGSNLILRAEQKTFGLCEELPFNPQCFQPFTSDRTVIQSLKFFVDHKAEDIQPIMSIAIEGMISGETFNLSSSYSPRLQQDPFALPPADTKKPVVEITVPTSHPTYTTSASRVVLKGNASDNVAVVKMYWRNNTTGSSGSITVTTPPLPTANVSNWQTPSILLVPEIFNEIIVYAEDAGTNVGSDKLKVKSTASLATPILSSSSSCSPTGSPRITLSWGSIFGASEYHIYRCPGICTPSQGDTEFKTSSLSYTDHVGFGETYSYRVRAHNHRAPPPDAYSDYSNTVTQTSPSSCTARYYACLGSTCTLTDCAGPCPPNECSSAGACCGPGCVGPPPPPPGSSFTLSASPPFVRVGVSGSPTTKKTSTDSLITVNPSSFSSNVSLSASGGPSNTEFRFSDSTLEADEYSEGSRFSVQIPDSTPTGQYTITVTGIGGATSDSVTVILDVFPVGGGQL